MLIRRELHDLYRLGVVGVCVVIGLVGCATEATLKQQGEANGHYQLGRSYLQTDLQKAIVAFERAINIDPNHRDAHLELGIIYGQRGRLDAAQEHYAHAIRIDPDYSEAHNNLGTVYARQARWDDAIEEYRKALDNPMYPWPDSAYYNLARALSQIGEYDEALIALRNASLIVPLAMPAVLIHREFGRIYEKVGDVELARVSYQEALEADDKGTYRDQLQDALGDLETASNEEERLYP